MTSFIFVLFTFAKVEVIWFNTFVSDQSLALLQVTFCILIRSQTKLLKSFEGVVRAMYNKNKTRQFSS